MFDLPKIVNVDHYAASPKYQQIVDAICCGIEEGIVKQGDVLPSINDMAAGLDAGRRTIERAYGELKRAGIIKSLARKHFYVNAQPQTGPIKVLVLFNQLSDHKNIVYDAFAEALGQKAIINFYIYNNDFELFRKLVENKIGQYHKVVVIPHFNDDDAKLQQVLKAIPSRKLILIDKLQTEVQGDFSAAYADAGNDIISALERVKERLTRYNKLKMIFPGEANYPVEILNGFRYFCKRFSLRYEVVTDVKAEKIERGSVYINLGEDDLVELVNKLAPLKLKAGEDVGIISYNETPVKKLILNGITTISTNFKLMGQTAARLVLSDTYEKVAIPFDVFVRNSL